MTKTTEKSLQNVAVVLVETPDVDTELELYEIGELVKTANGQVVQTFLQKRNSIDVATVLGAGKLDEIADYVKNEENAVDVVLFCNSLSSSQRENLSKALDVFVIDKTDLILDIFALHAQSAIGKKQVEMAQLSYSLATHSTQNFSRQGGGIGTRGPGETKLETNKRLIHQKITRLRRELAELVQKRAETKVSRKQNDCFTVSLVGYTNAGKSTLFNTLTQSDIYADNKLFATLDTTTRKLVLPSGITVLLSDTVGFIRNLPHQLIEAFKSTLEETVDADLVLNVCDVSDSNVAEHVAVTEGVLNELGVTAPVIRVYNKCDLGTKAKLPDGINGESVTISAKNGQNTDTLLEMIDKHVAKQYVTIKIKVPNEQSGKVLSQLNAYAVKLQCEYSEEHMTATALLRRSYLNLFTKYLSFD